MFAESLLETTWAQRTRRSCTTATSFGLLAVVIGVLITIPLLETVGLPPGRLLPTPISWGAPPPPAQPPHREHLPTSNQSNMAGNILVAPPTIPPLVAHIEETTAPPQLNYNTTQGVGDSTGPASPQGIFNSIGEGVRPAAAPPAPPTIVKVFKPSSLLQGSLVRRVEPVYPQLARAARVQGPVVLEAIISKDGTIGNLQLISGHPLLVQAAIAAVTQWRYRPYILNGAAIEVETRITVNFMLGN